LAGLYVLVAPKHGRDVLYSATLPEAPPPPPPAPGVAAPVRPANGTATGGVAPPPAPPVVASAPARLPRAIDAEWERRAVAANVTEGRAIIAVVIDDMGLDRARALRVIALPAPLTLSFLPYGRDAPALAVLARQRGHEIMLHMPMQPLGAENPGPQALSIDLPAAEVRARVGAALDRFGDAIGLNNHMGSRFTAEKRLLAPVMEELAARGLVFLDSRTGNTSQGVMAADDFQVPAAARDVFIDNDISAEAIARQLVELERQARRRGFAVAIGHPHDTTIAALSVWLPGLPERGIQAVPVTAVIRRSLLRGGATP
jgi:polysaccharide deacetylase 2 family uncharacterized protein YibQ